MKKIIVYSLVFILFFLILLFFFFDVVAKNIIEKNLSRDVNRQVILQTVKTSFLNGTININNIKIKNDKIFPREDLIFIPAIEAKLDISKIFSGQIYFDKIFVYNPTVNYDVIVKDGKIVDSFYLIGEILKKQQISTSSSNQKNNNPKTNSPQPNLPNNSQGPQIDFLIKTLILPKITMSVLAKDLQYQKNIVLDEMKFDNVGNIKNSNHYKDVMAMIVTNMAVKINNEIIVENLKNKFETKLKNLLSDEKLKSMLGSDSNKIIKHLNKLFK